MRATTKIAVCLNGWVLVGLVEDDHEQAIVFYRAAVIRRWGTTKGLGELAHGPTADTVIDPIEVRTKVEALRGLLDEAESVIRDYAPGFTVLLAKIAALRDATTGEEGRDAEG